MSMPSRESPLPEVSTQGNDPLKEKSVTGNSPMPEATELSGGEVEKEVPRAPSPDLPSPSGRVTLHSRRCCPPLIPSVMRVVVIVPGLILKLLALRSCR